MQIYLNFARNFFLINRSFGMGMVIYLCITLTVLTAQMSRKRYNLCAKASPAVVAVQYQINDPVTSYAISR